MAKLLLKKDGTPNKRGVNWRRRVFPDNVVGKKYGMVTILKEVETVRSGRRVDVKCDCGVEKTMYLHNLVGNRAKTCGAGIHRQTHGYTAGTRMRGPNRRTKDYYYSTWSGIKERCVSPRGKDYANYGGRGIKMYELWINDPVAFIDWIHENLGPRPCKKHSLDRIDNDGHYEPGNLRWATARQQMLNRRPTLGRDLPPRIYSHQGRFQVSIHVGMYDSLNEAKQILAEAEQRLGELLD